MIDEGPICATTYAEWLKDEVERLRWVKEKNPQYHARYVHYHIEKRIKRNLNHKEYPFFAVVKGFYPENDFACRWCWQNIGPYQGKCGECHSEYPGCPLVIATKRIEKGSYKDKNGVEHKWERDEYSDPGEHWHEGTWSMNWLGKTGYDYGYSEFMFKNESDRDRFLAAIPSFNFGENY